MSTTESPRVAPQPEPQRILDKLVWTYEDLTALTSISPRELRRMVARGELPKPKKRGKLRLFFPDAVRKALAAMPE